MRVKRERLLSASEDDVAITVHALCTSQAHDFFKLGQSVMTHVVAQ
jgi:hypothetical protein